jgi:hypothetical protein
VVRAAREDDPRVAPAAAALRAKYPQYASTPLFLGAPTLVRIEIEGMRGWAAGEGAVPTGRAAGGRRPE